MGLFHVVYNGYVCKTLFPYRHPERSRGIFLAYWYSAVCETAEKGKPFAKGARNDGVQGRFLAALEMTVWGNGYPLYHTKSVWEMRSSRIVIPSEAEGSFSLAVRGSASDSEKRETPYRGKTVGGASYKRLSEGGGKGGDEKDFSLRSK